MEYEQPVAWEYSEAERSIAGRLLREFLKYHLPLEADGDVCHWQTFDKLYRLAACPDLNLRTVQDVILPPASAKAAGVVRRVIVINFDEVSHVLRNDHLKQLFVNVLELLLLASVGAVDGCFFCLLLTSTQAVKMKDFSHDSRLLSRSISLPLLNLSHMYQVVQGISRLSKTTACQQHSDLPASSIRDAVCDGQPDQLLQDSRLRYFTFLLRLLGGVPRLLEETLFTMGLDKATEAFSPRVFLANLERVQESDYSNSLLQAVVPAVKLRYPRFVDYLQAQALFPLLVACSLFRASVQRSQYILYTVRRGGQTDKHSQSIVEMEDNGVVFLVNADAQPPLSLPSKAQAVDAPPMPVDQPDSPFVHPYLIPLSKDSEPKFVMVIPFIWIYIVTQHYKSQMQSLLPQVQLLASLDWSLTSSQKERLSLSVLALRVHFLIECHQQEDKTKSVQLLLWDVFPQQAHEVKPSTLRLPHPPASCSWRVTQCKERVLAHQLPSLADDSQRTCLFYQNGGKAPSADSFAFLSPLVLLQDKQSHQSKPVLQQGRKPPPSLAVTAEEVRSEHNKSRPSCDHVFVYITDKRAHASVKVIPYPPSSSQQQQQAHQRTKNSRSAAASQQPQGLQPDEILICADNEAAFFGDFLSLLKLYADREENVPRASLRSGRGRAKPKSKRTRLRKEQKEENASDYQEGEEGDNRDDEKHWEEEEDDDDDDVPFQERHERKEENTVHMQEDD
jgi:hypothetical protein